MNKTSKYTEREIEETKRQAEACKQVKKDGNCGYCYNAGFCIVRKSRVILGLPV